MPLVASGQFTITDYADNISMVLSSDSFIVATNSDGSNGNYSNCVCTVKVLHGFLDETSKWTITAGTPTGLTGVLSSATYTVSNATLDTSSVDITATRSGYPSITKKLSVSKAKAGATGAKGDQGPSVTVTANRAMSFTSTDGALDTGQADIVFTAATSGVTSPTYAWTFAGLQTNPTASTTATQTVTAAQFGTSRSATVTCTVGTYKQTLTIVRLEKSTADAGATVGATWGTNVGSIPTNISTAGSTPTVDLRNNQIGLNASGQLYGAGAGNGTTVSNAQISVDTATGVIGGIGTGAGTAVANSQVAFSARQTWEFRGSAEGWTASGGTVTANADSITLTSTGGDPMLQLSGLSIKGAVCDKLRMRVRRIAGTGWDGMVYYATSATSPNTHGNSESYCKVLPSSLLSTSFVMLEWDMANLTVGGNNWTASTITAIRFDLGSTASDVFEIDWISVGKYGHDVDLVLSASSQIIAGTSTNGVVLDAASKSLQVMTGGNERVRLGNQPTVVNGSAYGMVVKDTSGNVVFDSRNNVGIVGNQTHDNYNLGDRTTNPDWDTNANGTGNVALGANALRADGLAKTSTRSNNVALGSGALRYATTGGNIGIGASALRGLSSGNTGTDNIAIGFNAMVNAVVPTYNIAIGRAVLSNVSAGSENVAIGYTAMQSGTSASYSVAVGHQTLKAAQGYNNTALGYKAGIAQTSPDNNTLVGYRAGTYITIGGGNTYIGTEAGNTQEATAENMVVITSGFGDALVIDPNALAKIYGNKIWHEGSDGADSGLDADLLDGYQAAITATVSTVAVRDGSGDIHTRLIRSEYGNETTIRGALAYRVESTSGGNNYVRFCSDTAAIRTYLGVAAATHSHTMPAVGDWFNGGYMSIRSDGVMQAGKYLDWHNTGTDTNYVGRTWTDANGNLTHSAGLKVKGTSGLGYAFGGAVTQATDRNTGVTLDTPSGTINLFSTAITTGTLNKFTLTNSCIAGTDVVMVCMRNSGTGRYNVFVDRVVAGACDIRIQNQATVAAEACSINFAIIKGANA